MYIDVRPGSSTLGRNEIDLIKVVIKKVNAGTNLTGNVVFKINSGNVKVWTESWKGTEITSLPYTFPASQLDKILYIEALDASDYQGIELEVDYNGNFDIAKATAVWVTLHQSWRENAEQPVPGTNGTLPTLENTYLVNRINNQRRSVNGNRYGHGDFFKGQWGDDTGNYDKKFGGRILLEFQVTPPDATKLVKFDITRQRKTRTGYNYYGFDSSFQMSNQNTDFPNDPTLNLDNELPNDDSDPFDEDNTPNLSFIYSMDDPSMVKRQYIVYEDGLLKDNTPAFIVSRNTFREFVRAIVKTSNFPSQNSDILIGSRASATVGWHCTYYSKRFSEEYLFIVDNDLISASIPVKYNQMHAGNGTVEITNLSSGVVTDNFFLSYSLDANEWQLSDKDALEFATSGPPASDGTWSVTLYGVSVKVTPGSIPFGPNFSWTFNTFRTSLSAKSNEVNLGEIDPTNGF